MLVVVTTPAPLVKTPVPFVQPDTTPNVPPWQIDDVMPAVIVVPLPLDAANTGATALAFTVTVNVVVVGFVQPNGLTHVNV